MSRFAKKARESNFSAWHSPLSTVRSAHSPEARARASIVASSLKGFYSVKGGGNARRPPANTKPVVVPETRKPAASPPRFVRTTPSPGPKPPKPKAGGRRHRSLRHSFYMDPGSAPGGDHVGLGKLDESNRAHLAYHDRYLLYKTFYDAFNGATGKAKSILEHPRIMANFVVVHQKGVTFEEFKRSSFSRTIMEKLYQVSTWLPYKAKGAYLFSKFMGRYADAGDDWEARCRCIFESMASHRAAAATAGDGTVVVSSSGLRLGLDDMVAVYEIQVAVIHESFDALKHERPGMTKETLDRWLDTIRPQQEMEAMFEEHFGNIHYRMTFEQYLQLLTQNSSAGGALPVSIEEYGRARRGGGQGKAPGGEDDGANDNTSWI